MKTKLFLVFFLFLTSLMAQRVITLDQALEIAFDQSFTFKSAKYNLESNRKNLEAQKLGLLTSINMNFTLPRFNRSLDQQFNPTTEKFEYYKSESTFLSSRLNISQPILYTNSTISILGELNWRKQKHKNGYSKLFYSDLVIDFNQPIFEYNDRAASLRQAEINEGKSSRNFSDVEFSLIYSVTQSFYDLYKTEQQMYIAEESVKQNEEQYKTAKNKFMAGLTPEDELLQQEIALARSKNSYLDAKNNFENTKNNFKHLIGLPLEETIKVDANIEFNKVKIDLDYAVKSALEKNSKLLNSQDNIELSEMSIDRVSALKRIKFNLNLRYGVNKTDENFDNLLNDLSDNRSVSLTMSVPVLDWGANSRRVEAAEAELNLSKEQFVDTKIELTKQVKAAYNNIISAEASVDVLKKTVELAERSYEISLERFRVGKITNFELAKVQSELTTSKLSNLTALINYQLAVANLERITLTKFK